MYRRESIIKLLFGMIKEHWKMPKRLNYKLSEYRLNQVRNTMYDLERSKFSGFIAPNLKMLNSIDDRLEELHKEERQLIKYRLRA